MQQESIFQQPQRLNSLGYIINILRTFVKFIKQFIFLFVYLFIKNKEVLSSPYLGLIILGLLIAVALTAYVNFISFRYYINLEKGEFVVEKGLLSKSKIVIKFDNILQVNITQNILQKALSLYSLTLDTAGSDKVEVDLYALNGRVAKELKSILLTKINGAAQAEQTDLLEENLNPLSGQETILKLPAKNILLFSLLSNYRQGLALFFAFIAYLFQHIADAIETFEINDSEIDNLALHEYFYNPAISLILFLGIVIVTIPFLINIVRYFFRYFDFTIRKNQRGTFSMQYGLFNKVNTIFHQDKIQIITFKQNKLLKRLGIGILSLKQLVLDVSKGEKSSIDIPGIAVADRDAVYNLALGKNLLTDQTILKPKKGLLISRLIKMSIVFFVIVLIILNFEKTNQTVPLNIFYPFLVIAFLSATIYNYLFYKRYTLIYNGEFLTKRYGVWNEKEIIIPMKRLQSTEVTQSFFQRYAQSGNFYVSTAARRISFKFFPLHEVNQIVNYMLYFVEK